MLWRLQEAHAADEERRRFDTDAAGAGGPLLVCINACMPQLQSCCTVGQLSCMPGAPLNASCVAQTLATATCYAIIMGQVSTLRQQMLELVLSPFEVCTTQLPEVVIGVKDASYHSISLQTILQICSGMCAQVWSHSSMQQHIPWSRADSELCEMEGTCMTVGYAKGCWQIWLSQSISDL